MNYKSFHHWLRFHILKSKMSVRSFAEKAQCGVTSLYRYLNGVMLPHIDSLAKICLLISKLNKRDVNEVLIEAIQACNVLTCIDAQANHGRPRAY